MYIYTYIYVNMRYEIYSLSCEMKGFNVLSYFVKEQFKFMFKIIKMIGVSIQTMT